MRKRSIQKKKLRKECYNLDSTFYKWLLAHLKQFLKDSSKIIDLSAHKFEICGEAYTLETAIKRMIKNLEFVVAADYGDEGYNSAVDETLEIWQTVIHHMWW